MTDNASVLDDNDVFDDLGNFFNQMRGQDKGTGIFRVSAAIASFARAFATLFLFMNPT